MISEEHLDSILIRQKDNLLQLIRNGKFREASSCLAILEELWRNTEYGYKYNEVREKLHDAVRGPGHNIDPAAVKKIAKRLYFQVFDLLTDEPVPGPKVGRVARSVQDEFTREMGVE